MRIPICRHFNDEERPSVRLDPLLVPGTLAFGVFVALIALSGGWPATVWYPAALFVLLLTGFTVTALPAARPGPAALASLLLLAAFTAWSYASISWAEVKADSWDGANRTLLYLVVYALFARFSWRASSAAVLLGGFSLALASLAVVQIIRAASVHDPSSFFLLGRFAGLTGYQNADCAILLMAFWPALFLSSARPVPWILRAVLLAAGGVLLELALMIQSRASVVALPLTFLAYLALVRNKTRAILFAVPPLAATALAAPRLLHVFVATRHGTAVPEALDNARNVVLISVAGLLVIGAAAAFADCRFSLRPAVTRVGSAAVAVGFAAAVVGAFVFGAVAAGDPAGRAQRAWQEFSHPVTSGPTNSYLGSGFGSNRYDIWRVALREFRTRPATGIGVDNFAVGYLRERRTVEEPLYPHSLELRVLIQTGIVGAVLFAGFLAAAAAQLSRSSRPASFEHGIAVAALAVFGYWFVHGSVDWFWEEPGLGAPAFATLGLAIGVLSAPDSSRPPWRLPRGAAVLLTLAAVVAVASLALPWLAAKEVQAAARNWRADPRGAFAGLDRARRLNPLSDRPDLVAGAIASHLGDRARMRSSFARAIGRNPHSWYAWLELGVVDALEGRRSAALQNLARARTLDPGEGTILSVIADVRSRRRISPQRLDQAMLSRINVAGSAPSRR